MSDHLSVWTSPLVLMSYFEQKGVMAKFGSLSGNGSANNMDLLVIGFIGPLFPSL